MFFLVSKPSEASIVKTDSLSVQGNIPNQNFIEKYQDDYRFDYTEAKRKPVGFWDKIAYYIQRFLSLVFSNEGVVPYMRYAFFAIVFIIILFKLLGRKPGALFYSSKKLKETAFEEDIPELANNIDIDKQILECINSEDYRTAVRLQYIKVLNKLNNHDIIKMKSNKTYHDYYSEIESKDLKQFFIKIGSAYDFVWFGNFSINQNIYNNIEKDVESIIATN